jgi:hypothetical protein
MLALAHLGNAEAAVPSLPVGAFGTAADASGWVSGRHFARRAVRLNSAHSPMIHTC